MIMAAAAGAPTVHKTCDQLTCQIQRYDCVGLKAKKAAVTRLANMADEQQVVDPHPFDPRVLPWQLGCESGIARHYVAQAKGADYTICGWLSINVYPNKKFNSKLYTYAYINKISTRRRQSPDDPYYGGVGKCLHDRLVADLTAEGFDFICLYPIDKIAEAVYTKWGYIHPPFGGEVNQMFFTLKQGILIPSALLETMRTQHDARIRNELWEIANGHSIFGGEDGAPNAALIEYFNANRRNLSVKAITKAIDVIGSYLEDQPLSMEQQQDLMLKTLVSPAGGRRTRRRRRHSRTKRFIV